MKKRGFTLIELLAVIIILAVVALIATPIILNVVDEARESSADSEAKIVLSGLKTYCQSSKMKADMVIQGYDYECMQYEDEEDDTFKNRISTITGVPISKIETIEINAETKEIEKLIIKENKYSSTIDLVNSTVETTKSAD